VSRKILTKLSQAWCAIHRTQFSWSPTTYERANYVREGGLSALGPDLDEIYDRATYLIDRLLKGAKPADLPFEQPTRFHLSVNLETAKALGITVPASVIARADEVIE
jgi:ABC-type uncharacterized transport system substrate-binding protein